MRRGEPSTPFADPEVPLIQSTTKVSYQEFVQATKNFSESNLLRRGIMCSVFIGTLSDSTTLAIKVLDLESEKASRSFNTVIVVLSSVRHRNLIKTIGYCIDSNFKALVLEIIPGGSLEKWLDSTNYFLDL